MDQLDIAFDDRNVPTELIAAWRRKEIDALGEAIPHAARSASPGDVDCLTRALAVKMAATLSHRLCRLQKTEFFWFSAVQLYDLSADGLGEASQETSLVRMLAASRVATLMDNGHAVFMRDVHAEAIDAALEANCALISQLTGHAVSMSDVHAEATLIVRKFSSCVTLPTVANWISVFVDRLDVLTHSAAFASAGLKIAMLTLAEWFAAHTPTSQQSRPHYVALGIFAVLLAGGGLVSLSDLQQQHVGSSEQWAVAVSALARAIGVRARDPVTAVSMDMLEVVTGSPDGELRASAHSTLTTFATMLAAGGDQPAPARAEIQARHATKSALTPLRV